MCLIGYGRCFHMTLNEGADTELDTCHREARNLS